MITEQERLFLRESNAIEGVYDDDSLEQAIVAWEYLKGLPMLTVHDVLKTHKLLMLHQPGLTPDQKGYFRRIPVFISNHPTPDWREVPQLIQNWCFEGIKVNPPIDPIGLHVEYEKIHPFVDGNGRTGRMFMNYQRVVRLKEPLLIFDEEHKHNYYKLFQ